MKQRIKFVLCAMLAGIPATHVGATVPAPPPIIGGTDAEIDVGSTANILMQRTGPSNTPSSTTSINSDHILTRAYYKTDTPLAGAYVNVQTPTNKLGLGASRLSYSFVLNGDAGTQVPIHLDAYTNLSEGANPGPVNAGGFFGFAFVHLIENPDSNCDLNCSTGNIFLLESKNYSGPAFFGLPDPTILGNGLQSFSGDLTLDANTDYRVDLVAFGVAAGHEYGSARADPYFYIEPDFLSTHPGYSLTFSDGVVNAPIHAPTTVPEASTWAMMIIGMGFAGGSLRARRRPRLQVCSVMAAA
jgi:hypothetical protein